MLNTRWQKKSQAYQGYMTRGRTFLEALANSRRANAEGGVEACRDDTGTDILEKVFDGSPNESSAQVHEWCTIKKSAAEGLSKTTALEIGAGGVAESRPSAAKVHQIQQVPAAGNIYECSVGTK
ncbi:hypothetical protein Hypma_008534 [Hypsizygus marmoreus]|uniref:Uncharacterized protein n=1 Tax=Hypsizygus marmoreus TaxID=39966 RepID=A0A369JT01_HYPMA|nr:hypothetical protein Hypma_008534 [Hypsizygus marmoreus]